MLVTRFLLTCVDLKRIFQDLMEPRTLALGHPDPRRSFSPRGVARPWLPAGAARWRSSSAPATARARRRLWTFWHGPSSRRTWKLPGPLQKTLVPVAEAFWELLRECKAPPTNLGQTPKHESPAHREDAVEQSFFC